MAAPDWSDTSRYPLAWFNPRARQSASSFPPFPLLGVGRPDTPLPSSSYIILHKYIRALGNAARRMALHALRNMIQVYSIIQC